MPFIFKPYVFLILVATLFLIASFFVASKTIEVNLADAYYVIGFIQFLRLVAVILFVFSALYKLLNRFLNLPILNYLHIGIMLITIGIFIFADAPFGRTFNWIFLIFGLSQLFFLINIFIGASKKQLNNSRR